MNQNKQIPRHEPENYNDNILGELINKCVGVNKFVAVCVSSNWSAKQELIQFRDGNLTYQYIDDYNNSSEIQHVSLNIDFRDEFKELISGKFDLRTTIINDDFLKKDKFARVETIYLVVGSKGEWVTIPGKVSGETYENNVINRICQAFQFAHYDGRCSFTLTE